MGAQKTNSNKAKKYRPAIQNKKLGLPGKHKATTHEGQGANNSGGTLAVFGYAQFRLGYRVVPS